MLNEEEKIQEVNEEAVQEEQIQEPAQEPEVQEAPAEEKPQEQKPDTESNLYIGPKLAKLLEKDLKAHKKYEKTRASQMFAIFASHNFYSGGFTPEELRTTLEDLGPTYVKIGQIMSSRPDMLPENYCKELEKLRQTVKPLDPEIVRAVIEDETGKDIDEIYSEFRDKPLGSASIGQAHFGILKDGTKVVTKVQRPLIADMMVKDFVLLKKLAGLVNIVTDTSADDQVIDLVSVIDELEKVSMEELDFRVEAANTKFFKENCIEDENVLSCPTVIDELTTKRIFTMTYVDGYSVSKKDKLIADGYDPVAIGTALVNNYAHQILDVGTFHADPHQGNIMVSQGKPYWIDFGMIGRISQKEIDLIQSMILSCISADAEGLVNVIMSMGAASSKTNRDKLAQDVELFLTRFGGASSINDVDVSSLFGDVMDLGSKHHVSLPGTYTLLARSVLAIEGVIEQLCPELNLMDLLSKKLIDRLKQNFDTKQTLLDAGKGALGLGKKAIALPGLAADALSAMAKGRTKINMEMTGLDEPLENISRLVKNVVLAIISCVMFIGGCILASIDLQPKTPTGVPLLAVILMVCAVALAIYSIQQMCKKKKK